MFLMALRNFGFFLAIARKHGARTSQKWIFLTRAHAFWKFAGNDKRKNLLALFYLIFVFEKLFHPRHHNNMTRLDFYSLSSRDPTRKRGTGRFHYSIRIVRQYCCCYIVCIAACSSSYSTSSYPSQRLSLWISTTIPTNAILLDSIVKILPWRESCHCHFSPRWYHWRKRRCHCRPSSLSSWDTMDGWV